MHVVIVSKDEVEDNKVAKFQEDVYNYVKKYIGSPNPMGYNGLG